MIDTAFLDPISWNFSVSIQGFHNNPYKAYNVFSVPAAFASEASNGDLRIFAHLPNIDLTIFIPGFNGVGEYIISRANNRGAIFDTWNELPWQSYSLDTLRDGKITIDQFDKAQNKCSGTFSIPMVSSQFFSI